MIAALILLAAFAAQPQANLETSDGFYCFTPTYLAYETLLHDSPERHLLHVVSLGGRGRDERERAVPIPLGASRGIRCTSSRVDVRDNMSAVSVSVTTDPGSGMVTPGQVSPLHAQLADWQSTRLWGTGSWALRGSMSIPLRRFADGRSVSLETTRVSNGGADCYVRVGARLAWRSPRRREERSQAIFHRHLTCKRAGLTGGPVYDDCAPQPGRQLRTVSGRVEADNSYRRVMSPFVFELRSEGRFGWRIRVTPIGEDRDLTSLIPLHGASSRDVMPPNAAQIASGRWGAHPFSFHPEARRSIVYSDDTTAMLVDDVRIDAYGRGGLTVTRHETSTLPDGNKEFRWIEFKACLSFPAR